jgi:hypothetical protein
MKQTNKIQSGNYTGIFMKDGKKYFSFITLLLLALFILNPTDEITAQKKSKPIYKLGGGIETYVSGNWHGAFYSPYASIGDGKNFLNFGPVIQKRSMLMQGAKIAYSRVLTGGEFNMHDYDGASMDGNLQLNFFCYAQYVNQLPLSFSAVTTEELIHASSDLDLRKDWSKVKLSTAEFCAGFELHVKITQNISWKNYIGSSVYYHLNYIQGMYQSRLAPVIMLGTGICIKHF